MQTPSYNTHMARTPLTRSRRPSCHVTTLLVPGLHRIANRAKQRTKYKQAADMTQTKQRKKYYIYLQVRCLRLRLLRLLSLLRLLRLCSRWSRRLWQYRNLSQRKTHFQRVAVGFLRESRGPQDGAIRIHSLEYNNW